MKNLIGRLCLFLLPVALYLALFAAFEPYNYFGLRAGATDTNQPIYRVRRYLQQPEDVIFLGDSRMAHLDMDLAGEILGTPCANLAFGGASEQEMIDLFWFAVGENPNLKQVYLEVSFYTMNRYYDKDRAGNIRTIARNPLAYMLNLSYNLEMLANLKNTLTGTAPAAGDTETATYTPADYRDEAGDPLPYRRQLIDYAATIYGVVTSGADTPADPAEAVPYMTAPPRRWTRASPTVCWNHWASGRNLPRCWTICGPPARRCWTTSWAAGTVCGRTSSLTDSTSTRCTACPNTPPGCWRTRTPRWAATDKRRRGAWRWIF